MGPNHDSHSPGTINTPKYENPLGFAELLLDLAYVGEIANWIQYCSCARNARSGLLLNGLQNYFPVASSACKNWIYFMDVIVQPQMSVAFAASHCCMKQAFTKQKLNTRAFFRNNWHEVKYVHEVIHAGT